MRSGRRRIERDCLTGGRWGEVRGQSEKIGHNPADRMKSTQNYRRLDIREVNVGTSENTRQKLDRGTVSGADGCFC